MALTIVQAGMGGTGSTTASSTGTGAAVLATQPSFPSTIGVGGATASTSGAGITFPATQSASSNANTLDDYEEGTWTPNVYHISTNNSTYAYKLGYYRKVGSIVHCWFTVDSGNSGTGGSDLQLSGLPFTSNSSFIGYGYSGIVGTNGSVRTGGIWCSTNATIFQLYNGGNPLTAQESFVTGYFSYIAS